MSRIFSFFTSSIGQKLIMSLSGLFLIMFLLVHLSGNFQLLIDDKGEQFNLYAHFMTTNPLIKIISYLLYLLIMIHAIQGMLLWRKNLAARKVDYAATSRENTSFAARNMSWLGIVIFIFLVLHMWQFWFQMKIGAVEMVRYQDYHYEVKNLYIPVAYAFSQRYFVLFYVFSMIVLGYHLLHGFQSAFQTLGLNHNKFSPLIKGLGKIYAIAVPLGFAIIPLYFYFIKSIGVVTFFN